MKKSIALLSGFLLLVSCATGKCREQDKKKEGETTAETATAVPGAELAATQPDAKKAQTTVKVFKYDGSKQCGQAGGTDLSSMEKQLKGIKVHSREKLSDGKMRIQMCGADTGQANVYEIPAPDLKAAQKAGFQEWKF